LALVQVVAKPLTQPVDAAMQSLPWFGDLNNDLLMFVRSRTRR